MKTILILISLLVISVVIFFLFYEDKRWVMLNGKDAELYATQLLNENSVQSPEKFIDYSVSVSGGYVIFSKHSDHSKIYGYFPMSEPADVGGVVSKADWKHLGGKWFVSPQ